MKRILVATALLAGMVVVLPQAMTAPEPYEVPTTWELKIDFQAPQPITVTLPGQKKPTTFWYMLYTVSNLSRDPETGRGADQDFIPEFIMYTNTGQSAVANRRQPAGVFTAIKKRHNNPLLKRHTNIIGKLLYGRDNAKDGVAIWPDFADKTGSIDVFVGGLSGETAELTLPRPVTVTETDVNGIEKTDVKYKVILHKSLRLNFTVKGTTGTRAYSTTKLKSKKWVLR
ncbi:MAG: hypothetical protein QGG42_20835 [Phycisphaerae bacterium]|nr:hypothetical protein [Phycisphaerae bacterium]